MGRNILSQFPNLCKNDVKEDERLKCCLYLHNLVEDMHIRFADFINLKVPRSITQPFCADPADIKLNFKISSSTGKK